jgi:phenylacetic acid degradation operon negative regulatory protein
MDTRRYPYAYLFSLFGGYVLPRGGEVWIGSLIQALGPLGFRPGAVRTLVSRMQGKGWLQSRRVGRRSFYRLSEAGLWQVHWGGSRAFRPPESEWDGHWTVVVYSVPEAQRDRRDALRNTLQELGFGALAPGTWLSPHPLSEEVRTKWDRLDLWPYLEVLRSEHLGPSQPAELTAHAWPQLPNLAEHYRDYLETYDLVRHDWENGRLDDRACFATRLQGLIHFVAITLNDPVLPPEFLPPDWPRPAAQQLFKGLQRTLREPAGRFFGTIFEAAPRNEQGGE